LGEIYAIIADSSDIQRITFTMAKVQLHGLLKFGSEAHIRDLYQNGTLYFNTLEKFRTDEDKDLRGDKYEGNSFISNLFKGDVFAIEDDKEILLGNADFHIRGYKDPVPGNVFCMYAIHTGSLKGGQKYDFDKRVLEFGSHFLAIDNGHVKEFLERVWAKLADIGVLIYGADLVKYYDPERDTLLHTDVFMKRAQYSFQNEFRIFAAYHLPNPFSIQIGSIEDIATVYESRSIFPGSN
jgi:hypothetical protein